MIDYLKEGLEARNAYLVKLRRAFHLCPELGFDLPETCRLVEETLDEMGIAHTRQYGQCSVVATVGTRTDVPVVAVRADMDALPVEEKTGLEFTSRNPGRMHACGHDAHMAVLLGVAHTLKPFEDELPFRLKMVFQPSEECAVSGAEMMVKNGVLDDVDYVLCMHVDAEHDVGVVNYARGASCSACTPIEINFKGKTSHATVPQMGSDALAMLVKTYNGIQLMLSRQIDPLDQIVCSVGVIKGGEVHNVVCDQAKMTISLRTFRQEVNDFAVDRIRMLAEHAAEEMGGTIEYEAHMSAPAVVNDDWLVDRMAEAGELVCGKVNTRERKPKMGSDDFAWFCQKKPSIYYWVGVRNLNLWSQKAIHNNDFMLDEDAMLVAENLLIAMLQKIGERKAQEG